MQTVNRKLLIESQKKRALNHFLKVKQRLNEPINGYLVTQINPSADPRFFMSYLELLKAIIKMADNDVPRMIEATFIFMVRSAPEKRIEITFLT